MAQQRSKEEADTEEVRMYDILACKSLGLVAMSWKFMQKIVPKVMISLLHAHKMITAHTISAKRSRLWADLSVFVMFPKISR